ncbi:4-cresol dehydrogenase [hydroxylating] flavoprotein subunit [Comamonadaceae bacterium OS-1]|nr:4-cresol dehydrogenase [hydroxylating] flavoprotein subunit [Comamonadaceae bacterium OS-1]
MDIETALSDWQLLLGAQQVVRAEAAQSMYGVDASAIKRTIPAALRITDAALLPEVMRIAQRHQVPVYPISTGHNWGYGTALPAQNNCVILDLSMLQKILHFDAEFGVVTLEPGVTQGMLADFLDNGNHPYLVPVTGAGPTCSLLANALERGYGVTPHTDHFGAVTDLEAVLADGTLYKTALREAGGEELARLFKWGIGPYSAGLFTQSGFGVVTRMTIALARRPECVKVCLFSLKDDAYLEPAVTRIRSILTRLHGTVGAVNLMNQHRVLAMSIPFPADRLDSAGLIPLPVVEELGRQYQIFPWTGFGTLYGTNRMVAAAQKEIRTALKGIASRLIFLSLNQARTIASVAKWIPGPMGQRLASTTATLAQSLELVGGRPNETALPLAYWRNPVPPTGQWRDPARDGCGLIWYAPLVPMSPTYVRNYANMVKRLALQYGMEPLITFTSISDKLFDSTVPLIFDRADPAAAEAAMACYKDLLTTGKSLGYFPYRVGVSAMELLSHEQVHAKAFHARLRASLDPSNILSPGRYQ